MPSLSVCSTLRASMTSLSPSTSMIATGFIRPQHAGILSHADTIDGLLEKMTAYEAHEPIFAMKADKL